jgi:hypothetical protein
LDRREEEVFFFAPLMRRLQDQTPGGLPDPVHERARRLRRSLGSLSVMKGPGGECARRRRLWKTQEQSSYWTK